jgi:hypothetical protein
MLFNGIAIASIAVDEAGRLRGTIRAARPIRKGRGLRWPFCGYRLRSVEVVQMRLAVAEIGAGPVFWPVALGGNVSDLGLPDSVTSRPRRPCRKRASSLAGFAGNYRAFPTEYRVVFR